jgi:DNA processing protein
VNDDQGRAGLRTGPDEDVLLARAAWSRLVEPGDEVAGALIGALGPVEALTWLRHTARHHSDAPGALVDATSAAGRMAAARLATSVARWCTRLDRLDPRRELRVLGRLGGTVVVPEDARWPHSLDDLGVAAPVCLWVRGALGLPPSPRSLVAARSVAVIGARACTAYGEHVTAEIAGGLAASGWTVVSGGAYGIDAVAHRAAMAAGGRTVAFLAGGVDRLYPAGNMRLLESVLDSGAVVSEVPPGSVPTKTRFLLRNRLIAASALATVVVEAAWRSGALSTARHAAALLRPVGAVPGPVTSAASAGCHRLLREGSAVCVTDAAEAADLAGGLGSDLAPDPVADPRPEDGLGAELRRTLDGLPVRRPAAPESVARSAGLTLGETESALGRLELAGLAEQNRGLWRRAPGQSVERG